MQELKPTTGNGNRLTLLLANREERRVLLLYLGASTLWTLHLIVLVRVQCQMNIEGFMAGIAEVFVLGHTNLPIEILNKILGLSMEVSSEGIDT
jgi:hypothetical protein